MATRGGEAQFDYQRPHLQIHLGSVAISLLSFVSSRGLLIRRSMGAREVRAPSEDIAAAALSIMERIFDLL